jgi:hypothetical protein
VIERERAEALTATISRTSSDSSISSQVSPIESESAPAILVSETTAETSGLTPGMVETSATDRTFRVEDIRVLPRDGAQDFGLTFHRRAPGTVVAQTLRKQLTSMLIAIVVCCLVFAAIYFFASI